MHCPYSHFLEQVQELRCSAEYSIEPNVPAMVRILRKRIVRERWQPNN